MNQDSEKARLRLTGVLFGADTTGQDTTGMSEKLLRAYVEATSDVVYRLNADWTVMAELDGRNFLLDAYSPSTTWFNDNVYAGDQEMVMGFIQKAIRTKSVFELEHRVNRVDGTVGWTYSKAVPIFDDRGEITAWFGAAADITPRKQAELNLTFLAEISQDLANLTEVDEMIATISSKIAAHFQLSRCAFVEIDEAADEATVTHDWYLGEQASLIGLYRISEYLTQEYLEAGRAGELFVVSDTETDPRTDAARLAKLGIRSFVNVPMTQNGIWRFHLSIYHSRPWNWRKDELKLIREITTRLWERLERLRAEEALRLSEIRYRTLFDSIDEGFCVIEMIYDETGKPYDYLILEVNPSFEVQTGLHDSVGRRVSEFSPDHEEYWFEIYGRVASTGEPVRFENEAKGLDGRWFDVYAFRVGGEGSRRVAALFNNVTERKKTDQALRESESFNRSIIDSSPDCIEILDLEGNLLSTRTGRTMPGIEDIGPFLNTSWIDFWKGIYRDFAFAAVESAKRTGEGKFRGFFHDRRGKPRWWDVAISPIHDDTGTTSRLLVVSRDVTDRHELEASLVARAEQLARADRSKDEFLAMLAHELRNPLAPLRNACEVLQTSAPGTPAHSTAHGIMTRQIENMSQMIDDLLDVSRITQGKIELRMEKVELETVLNAAASLARPGMEARNQRFTLTLPEEPVFLEADATRLDQVFGNLLTNASKYSPPGSNISILTELVPADWEKSAQVVIRVRDEGMGIAPELLPHIFDLFVQATRSLDRASGGLGIGLTLVRRLVELHGGTVEAFSEGPDRGSEFVVSLPVLEASRNRVKSPAPASSSDIPRRILIVDDNRDSADTMAMLQGMRGHTTYIAYNGPDALAAAGDFLPEVVLLDIGLPEMDGYEIARRLRSMSSMAGTFIVAVSGYGSDEDVKRAIAAGFNRHLVKPANLTTLREWLANLP
ncbi:PAS domain S-box protein [Luteolibacter yonseiensis]|uniref:histidine kinase n=1 Tax=Luteolibacter yonseiensis TaxID=1144680 RepID=A0A934VDT8_9BACT|nr:ATP-binding protein [Luteolibacter yonseiensis]MBK1818376.1 PAS domain S-box protein [Luteolibacter yonseiensis]